MAERYPAATRFREAMQAGNHAALIETLAPDVILRSPIVDVPFDGLDEARALYSVILEIFSEFEYLAEGSDEDSYLFAWRAKVGGETLEGVDLMRFDGDGQICEITAFMRPLTGLAAFSNAAGPKLARRLGGSAVATRLATPPGGLVMRLTARLAPRLLGLRRAR
jgi:hypothetical protein